MKLNMFSDLLAASPVSRSSISVLDDGRMSLTGTQLLERISDLRKELSGLIAPGDVVCVVLPSCAAYMLVQAALVDLGAVFVSVPADAPYLAAVVAERGSPRWYVYAQGKAEVERPVKASTAGILLVDLVSTAVTIAQNPASCSAVSDGRGRGRIVVATSGSTGQAKLVDLSPSAYWHAARAICAVTSVDATDRLLHHLPLQRGAGWLAWGALAAGAHNLIRPLRTADLPEAMRESRTTAIFSVNVGLHELVCRDMDSVALPHLRTLYYSSGAVSIEMKRTLTERFGRRLVQDYGMTEVPEPVTVLTREDHMRGLRDPAVLASVGRPLYRDRIKTATPNSVEPSTILVRSPYMFSGYWGEPARPVGAWYETDDLGYIDQDGYVYISGRRSRSVRSGGVSFALDVIESTLRSIPGVETAELVVVPDRRLGERVEVTVEVSDAMIQPSEIKSSLRDAVPDIRMAAVEISIRKSQPPTDDRTTNK